MQELNSEKDYVKQRIADFFTELLSVGNTGFSIYNAKYIAPDDYVAIFDKFKNNFIGKGFPDDFIVILEISIDNDGEKLFCNYNSGVNFADNFKYKLESKFSNDEIKKIKIQIEDYLTNKPYYNNNVNDWKFNKDRFVMSLENQDNQNDYYNNIKNKIVAISNHQQKYVDMLQGKEMDFQMVYLTVKLLLIIFKKDIKMIVNPQKVFLSLKILKIFNWI